MKSILLILVLFTVSIGYALEDSLFIECCSGTVNQQFLQKVKINNLQDLHNNKVNLNMLLEKNKYSLIVTCSPYLCGGCERVDLELINQLAQDYPKQVFFLLSEWNPYDTKKTMTKYHFDNNLLIYIDKMGSIMNPLLKMDNRFMYAAYFIVDDNLKPVYMLLKSYDVSVDVETYNLFITTVTDYLTTNTHK